MANWRKFEVVLPSALEDPASAVLSELGCAGWEAREEAAGAVRLLAYWAEPLPRGLAAAIRGRLGTLADNVAADRPHIVADAPVPEEDWEANWRRHFRAERPIPNLVIHPSWIPCTPGPGERAIVIDPKMAFGVGSHPTTRLCLRLMQAPGSRGRVLDLGAGTGILAIAAALWGAQRVIAADVDGDAVRNAAENVAHNGAGRTIRVVHGGVDALRGPFDQIVANLLSAEFRSALPDIARVLRPGGALILSGFLVTDENTVRAALAGHGLKVETGLQEAEWGALVARSRLLTRESMVG